MRRVHPALEHIWYLKERELIKWLELQHTQVTKQFQNTFVLESSSLSEKNSGACHHFPKEDAEVREG